MSEILLLLVPTLVLAIYLFYVIFYESTRQQGNKGSEATPEDHQSETDTQAPVAVSAQAIQKPVEPTDYSTSQPEDKPIEEAPAIKKPAKVEVTQDLEIPHSYRNPKTEESAPVPNNYRFAKRWIKTALVEEGLLDRIYRNNEMNEENSEKVKKALLALAQLPQYRG